MSVVQLASGKWRLQIRRKTLKVDELYATEAEAREVEQRLLNANVDVSNGMTLRSLWERYAGSQMFEEKAENTQRTERTHIKPVLDALGDCTPADLEADVGAIYDYMEGRRKVVSKRTGRKLSNTTRRLEVAALSALIAYAKQRRLVRENFVSNISRPTQAKRKRRVDPVEQGKLALFARNSDPDIAKASRFLLLIRHLGCRPGELADLLLADVDLDARQLLFRDTKNKTDRRVHITRDAATLLHLQFPDVPEGCPYVFFTWSRFKQAYVPYNYCTGVRKLKAFEVIGADMHAHAGRREFVSRAVEAGVPLLTIKKQTGHKSTQALEIYDEGLTTAPEVCAALDALAATVEKENLMSVFDALGMTDEQRAKLNKMMGTDGWVDPFKEAKK